MNLSNKIERHLAKVIRVTLLNIDTFEKYDLYYRLFNIPLAKKWLNNFQDLHKGPYWFRESKVYFKSGRVDDSLINNFNRCINVINEFYDILLPKVKDIDHEILNHLHEAYATYGARVKEKLDQKWWDTAYLKLNPADEQALRWPGITFNEPVHFAFIELNDLIHKTELFMNPAQTDKIAPGFLILASYNPRENFNLEKEDFPALKSFLDFGDFCLGYNTLGKNLRHIVLDGDRNSLEKNLITPQTTWSNEIQIHMKHSENNNFFFQEYFDKWSKINVEEYGFEYGDFHKNKEGYFCIGELVYNQKDKLWDTRKNGMKVDLSRYSNLYDISIISLQQYQYETSDPNLRLPVWKSLPKVNGKKIIKIENNNEAVVTWILNDICNYSCRYCPESLHNGKNYKNDWDSVSEFLQHINDMLGVNGRKIIFSISGGEPTLSPFFSVLIKKIYDLGHYTRLTTNLARTPRFIEENFKYILNASCSFHSAFEFTNNTVDTFIEKVKVSDKVTYTTVRVMMDPLYWDQCVSFIERLKSETTAQIEIVRIEDQYGNSNIKLCEIIYNQEQLDFFDKFQIVHRRPNLDRNILFKEVPFSCTMKYEDGTDVEHRSFQKLINNGQTLFYGYNCSIGKESIFIHQSGDIRKGNCHVGGKWGNIKEWKKIDWYNFNKDIICSNIKCSCGADVRISKYKL